ncbi:Sec20-domain-containing protein [Fomitiporia mediterranea MF3/22]|uniref:Sec20-domain-containing protein n=1 Tax=Fomitiporia mediterranea (strain MF3/22) TaxID=694068 RepID=UPI0004408F15|nr:Sec20-domain-containing protein [Fomitiporia mediterranea MF3/22]EJC99303.1 Sec20-domain-containing protein [Fomitiporia mediterranea MF3/22]
MAPIPQTLDDEIKGLIDNLNRRQKDLAEYQVPRLRGCKGPFSEQQRFAAELREDLDAFGKQIETLEVRAEDVVRKSDRVSVLQLVEEFRESSLNIRRDMRSALLHSKKTIDAQAKSNREELFRAATPDSRNVEEKATDDALMKASNDVTETLRRTIGLMQGELERSVLSYQMLEQSTATLRATSTQHDVLSFATHASKQLITALEKADWLDRLLILAALAFFVLVVLYILKQRILDRGIRIAFWWTRFLPSARNTVRGVDSEKAGVKVKSVVQEVVSTITAAAVAPSASVASVVQDASSITESASTITDSILEPLSSSLGIVQDSVIESVRDSISSTTTSAAGSAVTATLDALTETVAHAGRAEL